MSEPQVPSSYGAVDLSQSLGNSEASSPEASSPEAASEVPATGIPMANATAGGDTATTEAGASVAVTMENFEEIVKQSAEVPVLLLVTIPAAEEATATGATLRRIIDTEFPGRYLLGVCDGQEQPEIAQALKVQGVPSVIGLIAGRPIPIFAGPQDENTIKTVLGELLQAAEQMGVTGTVSTAPVAPPPPPATHVAAIEAEEVGDWDLAISKWEQAIEEDPSDREARHRLAQAKLSKRQAGEGAGNDDDPRSLADSFALNGNYAAAFEVLLNEVASHYGDEREPFRQQLVDLFEVAGDDPAVMPARSRLASLLF